MTLPTPPNPYVVGLKILLLVLVLVGLGYAGYKINSWRIAAEKNGNAVEQLNRTGQATTDIAKDVAAAVGDTAVKEGAVTTTRIEHVHKYEVLRNENKDVRDYTNRAVPMQLRELAKARRESRERLGSNEAGSPAAGEKP